MKPHEMTPPPGAGGRGAAGKYSGTFTTTDHSTDAPNPWRTTAAQLDDAALAAWLADVEVVLADAAGDDPVSASTRAIAALMREAAERELILRRRASARKPEPAGGLRREHHRRLREQIRARIDLVALIAEDVADLRRCGSSWRGRCPLHGGDNPESLTVWPARGRWRCWSCGLGGDAVAWVLATRPELDYRSALTHLALRAGIPLEDTVALKDGSAAPSRRRVIRLEVSHAR